MSFAKPKSSARQWYTPREKEIMRDMRKDGHSWEEIGERLNRKPDAMKAYYSEMKRNYSEVRRKRRKEKNKE